MEGGWEGGMQESQGKSTAELMEKRNQHREVKQQLDTGEKRKRERQTHTHKKTKYAS